MLFEHTAEAVGYIWPACSAAMCCLSPYAGVCWQRGVCQPRAG